MIFNSIVYAVCGDGDHLSAFAAGGLYYFAEEGTRGSIFTSIQVHSLQTAGSKLRDDIMARATHL